MLGMLRDRVTILRPVIAKSDAGEETKTFEAVSSNVPFLVQPRSGSYRQKEFGREREAEFLGVAPRGTEIEEGWRVTRGSETYDVTFVADLYAHHLELDLAKITTP